MLYIYYLFLFKNSLYFSFYNINQKIVKTLNSSNKKIKNSKIVHKYIFIFSMNRIISNEITFFVA